MSCFQRSAAALLWGLIGCLSMPGCSGDPLPARAEGETPAAPLPLVRVVQPQVTTLNRTTTQPVTVHPYYEAAIYAKVAGYLQELNVDIGSSVTKGDILGVIQVPEMVKQCERQEKTIDRLVADSERATADVDLAKANVEAAAASVDQAQADVQQTEADLTAGTAEFRRIESLVNSGTVESQRRDEARQRFESAQAAKRAKEAALRSKQANVTVAEASLRAVQADLVRTQADIEVARKQWEEMQVMMDYATLRAPFDGIVTTRNVNPGDLVRNLQTTTTEQPPLFTIVQVDRVRVQVSIPESDTRWATPGDPAQVRLLALPGQPLSGEISRVTRSLNQSSRTMLAEIDLDNPDRHVLPGMYGEATILLDEQPDVLVLPEAAVRFDSQGKAFVYTLDANDTLKRAEVTTGLDDGLQIEIVSGVAEGDRVVAGSVGQALVGQQVRVASSE